MSPDHTTQLFVARQPIFDVHRAVFAYELLLRDSYDNFCPPIDSDDAASRVISDSASGFGLDALTANKRAFVNFTKQAITEEFYTVLPPSWLVVELLETVDPDAEVIAGCKALKDKGYLLALDDFVDRPEYAPLVELADFIKVDFLDTPAEERWRIARRYGSSVALLAEKVETLEDVEQAIEHGYQYLQGFFFCRPEIIARRDIPGFKLNYLRFFEEISRPELDFNRLEQIIEREVSLSIKLLRLLNSAMLGYFGGVNTVWQALLVLGERTMKRWSSMIAMTEMGDDKPRELVVTCLVRARFCELLGQAAGLHDRDHDLFLVGMLSLIDALVGRPLIEVLDELAVSREIRAALTEADSPMAIIRALVVAHERGSWEMVDSLATQLSLSDVPIADLYRVAVVWADDVFQSHAGTEAPEPICAR